MAGRRSPIDLEKKTLNLGRGDFEAMGVLFPSLGASNAIRILVRNFITRVQASAKPLDIDISDSDLEGLVNDD